MRGSSAARGYGSEHETRFRQAVLDRDRWCVLCTAEGLLRPAVVADHYPKTRRELVRLGLDPNEPAYGRGLCARCHNRWTGVSSPGGWNANR